MTTQTVEVSQLMHDLADMRAVAAMKKEFWRRWQNGLSMSYDYSVVYERVYREALDAYSTSAAFEAGRIEAVDP